jgi:hypothetical protein
MSVAVFCSHLLPDVNTDVVAVECFRLHPLFTPTYRRLHVFLLLSVKRKLARLLNDSLAMWFEGAL